MVTLSLTAYFIFLGIDSGDSLIGPAGAIFLLAIGSVPIFGTIGIIKKLKLKGARLKRWITVQLGLASLVFLMTLSRFL